MADVRCSHLLFGLFGLSVFCCGGSVVVVVVVEWVVPDFCGVRDSENCLVCTFRYRQFSLPTKCAAVLEYASCKHILATLVKCFFPVHDAGVS